MAPQRKKQEKKKAASRPKAASRVKAKAKTKGKTPTTKTKTPVLAKASAKLKKTVVARKVAAKAIAKKSAAAKKPAAKKAISGKVPASLKIPPRPPRGKVVWHELYTTDVKAARSFYTALFGWTIRDVPMGTDTYALTFNGPRDVAGIMPGSPGQPSYWLGYIEVPNVNNAVAAIEAGAGRVFLPFMDLPAVGRFAVAADPEGAMFAPFTSALKKKAVAKPDGPAAGGFLWDELITSDSTRAKSFYGKVIGWDTRPMDGLEPGAYDLFTRDGRDFAGLLTKGDKALPSCWMTYIGVVDVDKAAARAQKLGGTIMKAPFAIPGVGRIAILRDPTGAAFGIYKPAKA